MGWVGFEVARLVGRLMEGVDCLDFRLFYLLIQVWCLIVEEGVWSRRGAGELGLIVEYLVDFGFARVRWVGVVGVRPKLYLWVRRRFVFFVKRKGIEGNGFLRFYGIGS